MVIGSNCHWFVDTCWLQLTVNEPLATIRFIVCISKHISCLNFPVEIVIKRTTQY